MRFRRLGDSEDLSSGEGAAFSEASLVNKMNRKTITKNRRKRSEAPGIKAGSGPMMSSSAGALEVPMAPIPQMTEPTNGVADSFDSAEGMNVHDHSFSLPSNLYLGIKRIFDVGVSVFALFIFGLILPLLSLIIKLDSPGSVFFSQERVGLNRRRSRETFAGEERRKVLQPGRPFKVLKLRTMGVNAEANGPQWASKNDVRVTRVGRFLRKTRLDEVPQFLNVLRGEMSLIGPRPERLVFVRQLEKEIPHYHQRLLVLPGITGLAQVINGYDDGLESVRRKIDLDRQYIQKAGFRQDSKILLNTVSVVLKGDGAL